MKTQERDTKETEKKEKNEKRDASLLQNLLLTNTHILKHA